MRWQRELTGEEMQQLHRAAETEEGFAAGSAVLESFYELALRDLGTSLDQAAADPVDMPGSRIDPKRFAIPQSQWLEVCDVLNGRVAIVDDDRNLPPQTENPVLLWMNTGPSAYLPDREAERAGEDPGDLPLTIDP